METRWEFRSAGKPGRRNEDERLRLAATGAGASGVFPSTAFEQALSADFRPEAIAGLAVSPGDLLSDLNGDGEHRAHLIRALCARAVARPGETQSFK